MNEKVNYILKALDSPVELTFTSEAFAKKYRLGLYHFRRIAALQDTRALKVKISLQNSNVVLSYNPEAHPV